MKTKRGIYLDLQESSYKCNLRKMVFYFSSQLYLKKFIENAMVYVNQQKLILTQKYKVKFRDEDYLILSYYKKIEKRGFLVYDTKNEKFIEE